MTYKGFAIYRSFGRFVLTVNNQTRHFSTLALAKRFIDRFIAGEID
jgi:hypothetical protein